VVAASSRSFLRYFPSPPALLSFLAWGTARRILVVVSSGLEFRVVVSFSIYLLVSWVFLSHGFFLLIPFCEVSRSCDSTFCGRVASDDFCVQAVVL
jgi:hypothetical protein